MSRYPDHYLFEFSHKLNLGSVQLYDMLITLERDNTQLISNCQGNYIRRRPIIYQTIVKILVEDFKH
jgi:hypothetical protein